MSSVERRHPRSTKNLCNKSFEQFLVKAPNKHETPAQPPKRRYESDDLPKPSSKQRNVANQHNKQRRAILAEWEASNQDLCWLVVWLAFREKGQVPDFPLPQLSHEWTNL